MAFLLSTQLTEKKMKKETSATEVVGTQPGPPWSLEDDYSKQEFQCRVAQSHSYSKPQTLASL